MIRGIVQSCVEGIIKRLSAYGRPGETISDREYFQHYGYTSRPKPGAEVIIIREGGHFLAIASDDRRYRIAMEEGEVALYTDEGDKIHLKRGRIIDIVGGEQVNVTTKVATVTASISATITAPQVILDTPSVLCTGDVTVGGNITATGEVYDQGGIKSMSGMRLVFNNHGHGSSPGPNVSM